jgi:hypothetical protein
MADELSDPEEEHDPDQASQDSPEQGPTGVRNWEERCDMPAGMANMMSKSRFVTALAVVTVAAWSAPTMAQT